MPSACCPECTKRIRIDAKAAHISLKDGTTVLLHWSCARTVLRDAAQYPTAVALVKQYQQKRVDFSTVSAKRTLSAARSGGLRRRYRGTNSGMAAQAYGM